MNSIKDSKTGGSFEDSEDTEKADTDLFDKSLVDVLNKRIDLQDVDEEIKTILSQYGDKHAEIDEALFLQDLLNDPESLFESDQESIERRYKEVRENHKIAAYKRKKPSLSEEHKKDIIRMRRLYKNRKSRAG